MLMCYVQVNFQVYYDSVMPFLKAILVNATDKLNRMLRAKAIECISLVGMAVGKEKFGPDAKQVFSCSLLFVLLMYMSTLKHVSANNLVLEPRLWMCS